MTSPPRRKASRRSLVEVSAVVEQHAGVLWTTALAVCVAGAILAWFVPSWVSRTVWVGAAVAGVGLLLGVAAMFVADALDRVVRAPRHVRAVDGELVAVLPTTASDEAARDLADAILDTHTHGEVLKVGISAVSTGAFGVGPWTDAIGVALARRGVSVLVLDLASGSLDHDGAAEVAAGRRRFGEVANVDGQLRLARLGPGRDPERALWGLPKLVARLPTDLDVLMVALPSAAARTTMEASVALDHMLLVAERDRTSRVELLTALTAVSRLREPAQVILLDDPTAGALGLTTTAHVAAEAAPVARDPFGLAARDLLPPAGLIQTHAADDGVAPESSSTVTADGADAPGVDEPVEVELADGGEAVGVASDDLEPSERGEGDIDESVQDEPDTDVDADVHEDTTQAAVESTQVMRPDAASAAVEARGAATHDTDPDMATGQPAAGVPVPSTPPVVGGRPDLAPSHRAKDPDAVDAQVAPVTDGATDSAPDVEATGPIVKAETVPSAPLPDVADHVVTQDDENDEIDEPHRASVEPRDVDVLLGAAAAEAALRSDADSFSDADSREDDDHIVDTPEPPADKFTSVGPSFDAGDGEVSPPPAPKKAAEPESSHETAVDAHVGDADEDDNPEDLLRTTAQMAILMEDLHERDKDR